MGLTPLALPTLGNMRSDSPPECPAPPGQMPRNIAPPGVGGSSASSGMEVSWETRLSRQPGCLGSTRMSDPGGLGFQPPNELPPLRDNPALSPLAHTPIRDMDSWDPLRADLKTPGGRLSLRTPNVRATAGRLSHLERSESAHSASDDRATAHEVDHLKRQVTRLTQLRRDRDNYIQDLLSEAEVAQRRHEGEMARRTVKSQREAAERLSAQQREHDLHLEERSRAHAAALAQQAWQHEREIEELRKSLRLDAERRLAERLTEAANHHRDNMQRLQFGIDDLRQRLATHNVVLGDACLAESGSKPATPGLPTATTASVTTLSSSQLSISNSAARPQLSSSSSTAVEPEPEEAVAEPGALKLLPRDAAAAEAMAERAANEAVEAVEWAITLARKDLENALIAGKMLTQHAASAHVSQLQDASQFEHKVKEAVSRLESDKRKLCRKSQDLAACAAVASSQTLLLKVLLVWGSEVRRLKSLVTEHSRVFHKRQQRQPLILARIRADVDQWLHIVFRTWVTINSNARREVADQESLRQREQEVADGKSQLRTNVILASAAHDRYLSQLALHSWASERRSAQSEAKHQISLEQLVTAAAAEKAASRGEAAREVLTLRLKWLSQGIQSINADLQHTQRASIRAWATVARTARGARALDEQLQGQGKELGESRRTQGLLVAQAAVEHTQLMAFHVWAAARLVAKSEVEGAHRLAAADDDAAQAKAEVEQQALELKGRLSGELRAQGLRLGRTHTGFQKRVMLLRWAVATREARREAAHRRQLITAAADASAEAYKLRAEAKKVAVELRKQRRAHGVAAIHANLDRRLQSVLLAWASVVRDGQREASYQRQLDISAAESAAGCAVLRMEGRRAILELREERRAQAMRSIDEGIRHWQHLTLREWYTQVIQCHRQESVAAERRHEAVRMAEAVARHRDELREQASDCEARISSSLSAAASGAEASMHQAEMQHQASLRAQEASVEAQASEVARLCAEREVLQAQIERLHDELRRNHNQP